MSTQDPVQMNVDGVTQLVGSKINKINSGALSTMEGVDGELKDELSLEMSDEELLELSRLWENNYRTYEGKIKERQEKNKAFYLGRQVAGSSVVDNNPIAGNYLFEAEETFLPAALSKNPEPVVWSDNSKEGTELANTVKTMLQYHADTLVLRRKLTMMTRHWSIYFLGAMKHGWNSKIDDIESEVVDPQCLILDPESCIDCYGDSDSEYIGERKTTTARKLVELFPKHKAYITIMVDGNMGTSVIYTEWWSDEYCFYTFKGKVLEKNKNPHFKYDLVENTTDPEGVQQSYTEKGLNHFAHPKKPYTFLSVFSLGKQPHDITGLIEQNIPNQNLISKRIQQIDKNIDTSNNSIAFSKTNFNEEEAKQAANAMQKGHPVLVPNGQSIQEAIMRFPAPSIPDSFFTDLEMNKQSLRSIFGTEGISAARADEQTTARGMILNQQFDNTRIGGGIGDSLEQVADNIFNWWVQMYYVYYDEEHFASIMGQMKAVEYITLHAQNLNRRLVISVAPDSMKPKDEITTMNQALDLWRDGALDPKTLLTMLNFPDPQTTAENTVLWLLDKNTYLQLNFPELAQKLQEIQQQQMAMGQGAPPVAGQEGVTPQAFPEENISTEPANAALSQVPLPT